MALPSAAPASPDLINCSLTLLADSKVALTLSLTANESWVMIVSVRGPAGAAGAQAAASSIAMHNTRSFFIRPRLLVVMSNDDAGHQALVHADAGLGAQQHVAHAQGAAKGQPAAQQGIFQASGGHAARIALQRDE